MPTLPRPRPLLSLLGSVFLLLVTPFLDSLTPLQANYDLLYVVAVLVALWSADPRLVWSCAVIATLLTLADWLRVEHPGQPLTEAVNSLLTLLAIWSTTVLGIKLNHNHDHLLRFRKMVEQSPVAIMLTEQSGRICYVNPQFTRSTGYLPEEVIGKNPRLLRGGDTPPETYREMWRTILAGRRWHGRLRNRHKDGTEYWEALTISPVHDRYGRLTYFIALMEDITEQIKRQRQEAQLEQLEVTGRLTSGIAHDFNNLLTIIIGNLHFLLDRPGLASTDREVLDDALSAAEDGAALCGHLLAFSHSREPAPEEFDLADRIRDLTAMLQRMIGDSYRLDLQVDHPSCRVHADPVQFDSALVNLVVNARDAMPEGGTIRIQAGRDPASAGSGRCAVRVEDQGCGIPPAILPHVTEPFFTTKGEGTGTGLGLSMVKSFVDQVGGELLIESQPGRGTTVTLVLPSARQAAGDTSPDAAPPWKVVRRPSCSWKTIPWSAAPPAASWRSWDTGCSRWPMRRPPSNGWTRCRSPVSCSPTSSYRGRSMVNDWRWPCAGVIPIFPSCSPRGCATTRAGTACPCSTSPTPRHNSPAPSGTA